MLNEIPKFNYGYNINSKKTPLNQYYQNKSYYNEPTYTEQYNQKLNYSAEKNLKLNNSYKSKKKRFKGRRIGDNKNNSFQRNKSLENIEIDKLITPKTKFNFTYTPIVNRSLNYDNKKNSLSTSKSYNKLNNKSQNINKSYNINNTSIYSSIQPYWHRREIEKINKLENIKNENLKRNEGECRERPLISKNSIKIAKKISNNKENVFDRLTNENFKRKHIEEVKKIEELNNKNKNPDINLSSRRLKRSIQDLYKWKNKIERKKNENIIIMNNLYDNKDFKINKNSQEILLERKPDYLNKKVEDRLLEQGKIIKNKKEEEKEIYLQGLNNYNNQYQNPYYFIESRYMNNNNKKGFTKSNSSLDKNKLYNISFNERIKSARQSRALSQTNSKNDIQKNNNNIPQNKYISYTQENISNQNNNIVYDNNKNKSLNNNYENNNNYINDNDIKNRNNNNEELMEIRRQLKEFYDMKKQFDTNLLSYQNNDEIIKKPINKNQINNIIPKSNNNYEKNYIPQLNYENKINDYENIYQSNLNNNNNNSQNIYQSNLNNFDFQRSTQSKKYNTDDNDLIYSYSRNDKNDNQIINTYQSNQPISSLTSEIFNNNSNIYYNILTNQNENQFENNIPKYNFNFGVNDVINNHINSFNDINTFSNNKNINFKDYEIQSNHNQINNNYNLDYGSISPHKCSSPNFVDKIFEKQNELLGERMRQNQQNRNHILQNFT